MQVIVVKRGYSVLYVLIEELHGLLVALSAILVDGCVGYGLGYHLLIVGLDEDSRLACGLDTLHEDWVGIGCKVKAMVTLFNHVALQAEECGSQGILVVAQKFQNLHGRLIGLTLLFVIIESAESAQNIRGDAVGKEGHVLGQVARYVVTVVGRYGSFAYGGDGGGQAGPELSSLLPCLGGVDVLYVVVQYEVGYLMGYNSDEFILRVQAREQSGADNNRTVTEYGGILA